MAAASSATTVEAGAQAASGRRAWILGMGVRSCPWADPGRAPGSDACEVVIPVRGSEQGHQLAVGVDGRPNRCRGLHLFGHQVLLDAVEPPEDEPVDGPVDAVDPEREEPLGHPGHGEAQGGDLVGIVGDHHAAEHVKHALQMRITGLDGCEVENGTDDVEHEGARVASLAEPVVDGRIVAGVPGEIDLGDDQILHRGEDLAETDHDGGGGGVRGEPSGTARRRGRGGGSHVGSPTKTWRGQTGVGVGSTTSVAYIAYAIYIPCQHIKHIIYR